MSVRTWQKLPVVHTPMLLLSSSVLMVMHMKERRLMSGVCKWNLLYWQSKFYYIQCMYYVNSTFTYSHTLSGV